MVKSVARFSGLPLICLIVTLTVPLIKCLPVEDQLNSNVQRFKRNVAFTPGSGSQSSSSSSANAQASSFGLTSNPLLSSYIASALNGGSKSLGGGGSGNSDSIGLLSGILQGLPFALGGTTKSLTGFLDNGLVSQLNSVLNGLLGGLFTGVNGLSTTIVPGLTNNLLSGGPGIGGPGSGGPGSGGGGGSKLPFGGGPNSLPFLLSLLGSSSSSKSQAQAQAQSQSGSIGLR